MGGMNEYLDQLTALGKLMREAQQEFFIERSREMERLRGVKIVRLPLLTATGTNPLNILPDQSQQFGGPQGPAEGYVWSLKHLVIEGMTRGGTPDVLQVTRQGRIIWELNGNQYAQTWGRGEIMLNGGEFLGYQSVGTFAATGKIIIHGLAWEVPGPEIGKLI